jgi:hypothetical protein
METYVYSNWMIHKTPASAKFRNDFCIDSPTWNMFFVQPAL